MSLAIVDERDALRRTVARQDRRIRDLEASREALRETARLAEAFARAKGRYHSQQAACDLMEHFGLPCFRPEQGD